jgi:SOS-response transcriptional repressor LexA
MVDSTLTYGSKLTDRQKEVLDFLVRFKSEHKVMPTFKQIMQNFNWNSKNSVFTHFMTLEKKGFLINNEGTREIKVQLLQNEINLETKENIVG